MAAATSVRKFSPSRPTSNFEARQAHLIDEGIYFAFFRKYSEPKKAKNFDGTGMEDKVFVSFLVTHSMNEKPLPVMTEAGAFIPYKWFYDAVTGISSKYFDFEHALVAHDYATKVALFEAPDEKRMDFDALIGRPALLEINRWTNSKTGMVNLGIQSFKPIPKSAQKILAATYKTFEFGYDDKGLRNIHAPQPVYADDKAATPQYTGHAYSETDPEEIPF